MKKDPVDTLKEMFGMKELTPEQKEAKKWLDLAAKFKKKS